MVAWVLVGCVPLAALAASWQLLSSGPISIRARNRAGTPVRELWAEGDIDAPLRDVETAILDCLGFPKFMPYVKECRPLGPPAEDGSLLTYSRMEPPLIQPRDYILKVMVDRRTSPDGTGEFISRWSSVPDAVAPVPGVVRIRVNEGSWHATRLANGKTHLVYRLAADPGGTLPLAIANLSNRSAVVETFSAIEHEAQRRSWERYRAAGAGVR